MSIKPILIFVSFAFEDKHKKLKKNIAINLIEDLEASS